MLRRLADVLQRPQAYLGSHLRHALQQTSIAALPFLYQRWVGWRLVLALQSMGFRAVNEPIGCLFLGGGIRLRTDDLEMSLWCEPRLLRAAHPSGLRAATREAQPDYVLVFPGQGGRDAFVLDATLASSRTAQKARYREGIELDAPRTIAGVPVRRRPLRAWAAAPTPTQHCDLHAPDGSVGTIPMLPGRFVDGPLRAWLQDAIEHARAWAPIAKATG